MPIINRNHFAADSPGDMLWRIWRVGMPRLFKIWQGIGIADGRLRDFTEYRLWVSDSEQRWSIARG